MKTPGELQADLKPFMEETFGGTTERERALLDEANKRLLGTSGDECPWEPIEEGTGLHKYGDNYLRPEFNPLAEAKEELLDALNMLGPFVNQRIALGIDKRGRLEQGFINVAVKLLFKALDAVHAAAEVKE